MENSSRQTPKIKLEKVTKTFGQNQVLRGIDLEIMPGESMVIIGGSGSGKSVLIKCILGLIKPDPPSKIWIDGVEVTSLSEREQQKVFQHASMLFQGSALFDSLPVWENICFGLLQTKAIKRSQAREIAQKLLPQVGLQESVADLYPAELSGGMQRRVALARAIATKPDIIFFDEPTTGLDPIMSGVIDQLILKNVKELGATGITITHYMSGAQTVADRVAMLYQGNLIWVGAHDALMNSDNPYVDQFVHGRTQGPIKIEV